MTDRPPFEEAPALNRFSMHIPIRDHPYDLELCDLCVQARPVKNAL